MNREICNYINYNAISSFPKLRNLFSWWFALRARIRCGHDLQTGILCTTTTNGQGHGGVPGHIHLTHRGASALSGQAPHRSDPKFVAAQWTDLSTLCSREWWNQEANLGATVEGSHPSNFIVLWEPDHVGTEEVWDLNTLYWLSGTEQDHYLE